MRNRNIRSPQARNILKDEVSPLNWRYSIVMIICGCVLVAGFFFAARQHFMSMEFGINNSKLRKQLEDLESENRRLLNAREVALSPGEIKRVARSLGFREPGIGSGTVVSSTDSKAKIFPFPIVAKQSAADAQMPNLIRTAYQQPTAKVPPGHLSNSERIAKQIKKSQPSNIDKERAEITTIAKLR